jgi:hypothetical protein
MPAAKPPVAQAKIVVVLIPTIAYSAADSLLSPF